jgi:hypothetical protein
MRVFVSSFLSMMLSNFTSGVAYINTSFFSRLTSIILFYFMGALSTHWLMDIWVALLFCLLWMNTSICVQVFVLDMFVFLLDIHLLTPLETDCKGSSFFLSSSSFIIIFFDFGHPSGMKWHFIVALVCTSVITNDIDKMCFSCAYLPSVYLLWRTFNSFFATIFNWAFIVL